MRQIRTRPVDVLLVDDTDDDVVLTRAVLAGTERLRLLHVAPGGPQALEYLRRQGRYAEAPRPDLVLADVNMPGMSGFELLEAIKRDPELQTLPVVILTVSMSEDDVARAYRSGAASFVRKPVSFDEFERIMRQFEEYWLEVASLPR